MSERMRADLLNGRVVRDANGNVLGRIRDMRFEERDGELVLLEYHVGTGALLERLGMTGRILGVRAGRELIRVPWHQMDLSNPDAPRLLSAGAHPGTHAARAE